MPDNLPAVRRSAAPARATAVKLPFTVEMILNPDTGQLAGMMLTSSTPEAAKALDRLMNGEYPGMAYCDLVSFRSVQYMGSLESGTVWLQRETPPAAGTAVTVNVTQAPNYTMDR